MVKKNKKKGFLSDKVFDIANVCIMIILFFVFTYPLYYVLISSFSSPAAVWSGSVTIWPQDFTLIGYKELLGFGRIWIGYRNTIFYTVAGTMLNVLMTVLCAYPLSQRDWLPRNLFLKMCLFTMYFNGGLIPTYLVVKSLGLTNTGLAMIIPTALSFYNALIVRNYFMNSIPVELNEAAKLDGANAVQYLVHVVLPLSKPVLAVVTLYYAVSHWNDYYNALVYIFDRDLQPLQSVLREVFASVSVNTTDPQGAAEINVEALYQKAQLAQNLKFTSIIVSMVPMLVIYPFIQKYFVKGAMIGAVKG